MTRRYARPHRFPNGAVSHSEKQDAQGNATPHPWIRRQNGTDSGTLPTHSCHRDRWETAQRQIRDVAQFAYGAAILGALYVTNVALSVYEVTRRGQGEAFRPSGGHRLSPKPDITPQVAPE